VTAVLSAMRVEITFSTGDKQVIQAQSVAFLKECKGCGQVFRTDHPRKEYHSSECREGAKYRRWQTR
jgi:hypothetical protein